MNECPVCESTNFEPTPKVEYYDEVESKDREMHGYRCFECGSFWQVKILINDSSEDLEMKDDD